jgi:Na+/melibiose symporter-like transporter
MIDPSLRLLREDRPFAWYWMGQSVSVVGSQVTSMALPLVTVIVLGGTAAEVGLVAGASTLPYLLFSVIAGHLLEGRPKRRVMVAANLAQAILILAVPACWLLGILSVPLLVGIAFAAGTAALCFGVVGFSYVPDLVDRTQLAAGNRAVQGSRTVADIAGPGLAGVLIAAIGAPLAMLVDGISYLASAVGIIKARPRSRTAPEVIGEASAAPLGILAGVRVLFGNGVLRALTIHAAMYNLASEVFMLNLLLWVVREQGVTTTGYGVAIGMAGVGGLIGTLTALRLASRLGIGRAFIVSLALSCVVPLLAVSWDGRGIALAVALGGVMLISGAGLGNANVYSLTLRHALIPRDQLTRSAGAYTQVMYGSIPLGALAAGILGTTLGFRSAAFLGACGMAISILPMLIKPVRRLTTPDALESNDEDG